MGLLTKNMKHIKIICRNVNNIVSIILVLSTTACSDKERSFELSAKELTYKEKSIYLSATLKNVSGNPIIPQSDIQYWFGHINVKGRNTKFLEIRKFRRLDAPRDLWKRTAIEREATFIIDLTSLVDIQNIKTNSEGNLISLDFKNLKHSNMQLVLENFQFENQIIQLESTYFKPSSLPTNNLLFKENDVSLKTTYQ